MNKILSIDPGSKKTGFAISDRTQIIAFAFKTLQTDELLNQKIQKMIEEEGIVKIIVGTNLYPSKNFNSKEWIKQYLEGIKQEIIVVNEDFSTFEALEKNPDADKDQAAAQYILQQYLDKQ